MPADESERFYGALDADVERRELPVWVLLTAPHHRRSADEVAGRYGATVWDGDDALPQGAQSFPVEHPEPVERALWLEPLRALVVGDALTTLGGELEVRRGSGDHERLLHSLRPLAFLPADYVIVGHGPPATGPELGRALDRPSHL